MRTAFDAIASLSHNIPTTAQVVMGYVAPSRFAWSAADWARFPDSVHVRITPSVATTGLGIHLLDVEKGDATPAQAPGWAATQRRLGQIPSVYCSAAIWATVQDAFNAADVAHPEYVIAAYPGTGQNLPTLNGITAVGHQYASTALYDLSVVADYWPGVDGGTDMPLTQQDAELVAQTVWAQTLTSIDGKQTPNSAATWLTGANMGAWAAEAGIAQLAAAVQAEGTPQVTEAELQAALAALNIGPAVAAALAALLAKAAGGGS